MDGAPVRGRKVAECVEGSSATIRPEQVQSPAYTSTEGLRDMGSARLRLRRNSRSKMDGLLNDPAPMRVFSSELPTAVAVAATVGK